MNHSPNMRVGRLVGAAEIVVALARTGAEYGELQRAALSLQPMLDAFTKPQVKA